MKQPESQTLLRNLMRLPSWKNQPTPEDRYMISSTLLLVAVVGLYLILIPYLAYKEADGHIITLTVILSPIAFIYHMLIWLVVIHIRKIKIQTRLFVIGGFLFGLLYTIAAFIAYVLITVIVDQVFHFL